MVDPDIVQASKSPAERAVGSMGRAILVFRWAAFVWVVLYAWSEPPFARPWLVVASLVVIGGWTLWLTVSKAPVRGKVLVVDVAIAAGLQMVSGLVVPPGEVVVRPLFALSYPFCAILSAGAAYGPTAGIATGMVMSASYFLSRPLNGLPDLTPIQIKHLANGSIQFVFAGLLFGIVSSLLRRSSEEVRRATAEAITEREKAARLAERESLARQIHDSALQVLALIHKKGIELAESGAPPPEEVAALAELAKDQEAALRSLILRAPQDAHEGQGSLRDALEGVASKIKGLEVTVSSVGPVWLPSRVLEELIAAVEQALANVAEHAGATKVAVFADNQGGLAQVTVRDDGVGFEFDEEKFRAEGKFGVLNSMKGRVQAVGGEMRIESTAGSGTEVEFRVPAG
ncbi:MAG: ATP-binding protein [Actinomycetota bacterium]